LPERDASEASKSNYTTKKIRMKALRQFFCREFAA